MIAKFSIFICLIISQNLYSVPLSTSKVEVTEHPVEDLEVRVWQAREDELYELENKIVRKMQDNPSSTEAHYLLSHLYLEKFSHSPGDLGLLKQASELAQQAAELEPMSDLGVVATCELLDVTGQSKKAISLLSQAMGSGINVSWRSYFMLGKLKAEQESFDKVLELFKQALAFNGSKSEIIVPHIIAALKSKHADNPDLLEEQLVSWNSMFPSSLFLESLAGVMIGKGNYKSAERIYQMILKKDSSRIESQINYAILKLNFLKRTSDGLDELQRIAKIHKNHLSEEFLALIYSNIALAFLEQNKDIKAQEFFLRVHTHANEEYALGIAQSGYSKHKRHKQFINFLEHVVNEIGGSGLSFALIGETYAEQMGQPDKAIEAYKNAILIDDKVSYYHNGLGLAYHKKKDFNTALTHFENAVKVDPSDAVARYNLACMQSRLGKVADALASIQEAFALSPDLMKTAQSDPDLHNIRNLQAFKSILTEADSIDDDIQEILSH